MPPNKHCTPYTVLLFCQNVKQTELFNEKFFRYIHLKHFHISIFRNVAVCECYCYCNQTVN